MSTILFYSPFNQRSRDTESLMIGFHRQGHRVISLSQAEGLQIHEFLRREGIETYSFIARAGFPWLRHWQHLFFLVRFCRRHRVQVVYSHLESANFIASLAQYFIGARVYVCRHHSDQYRLLERDRDLSYNITYKLARNIIAVSETSKNFMIAKEGIDPERIIRINLAFDFTLYQMPNPFRVEEIKKKMSANVVLITVGSMNNLKRPEISVLLLKELVDRGLDAKLILLGSGEQEPMLTSISEKFGLANRMWMPGYVNNVLDYIAAAKFLIHPSVSESSCVVVKEAGLVGTPVIVCRSVGDFDDYVLNENNGFLLNQEAFVKEAVAVIERVHDQHAFLQSMGESLRKSVFEHFSPENVLGKYDSINSRS